MGAETPHKTLAQLAAEQGVGPVESIDDLAAKEPLTDSEYAAFAAAIRECRSDAWNQISDVLHGLVADYQNLATIIAGNERVPADLRTAVTQHVASVLSQLPQQLREALAAAADESVTVVPSAYFDELQASLDGPAVPNEATSAAFRRLGKLVERRDTSEPHDA